MAKAKKILFALKELSRLPRGIYSLEILLGVLILRLTHVLIALPAYQIIVKFLLFISGFQIAYFAVYIINDILDYHQDKLNPNYKDKPLVSRVFSISFAWKLALVHITIGLLVLFIIQDYMGILLTIFMLAFNIFYTKILKKTYLTRILGNSFTHTFRILIGLIWFSFHTNLLLSFNHIYLITVVNYFLIGMLGAHLKQLSVRNSKAAQYHKIILYLARLAFCLQIFIGFILNNKQILIIAVVSCVITILFKPNSYKRLVKLLNL